MKINPSINSKEFEKTITSLNNKVKNKFER